MGQQAETGVVHSTKYVIRRAERQDIPAVIRINRLTLPENYPEWFFYEHLERWGDAFYIAVVGGEVVGYVMSRVEHGISVFNSFKLVRKGHIVSIAVLPEHRRKGIGTALMKAALKSLREIYGCDEVYLEVRVSNTPAIRMYERLGFKKVKIVPMYYLDGEDAYIMAVDLREKVQD